MTSTTQGRITAVLSSLPPRLEPVAYRLMAAFRAEALALAAVTSATNLTDRLAIAERCRVQLLRQLNTLVAAEAVLPTRSVKGGAA